MSFFMVSRFSSSDHLYGAIVWSHSHVRTLFPLYDLHLHKYFDEGEKLAYQFIPMNRSSDSFESFSSHSIQLIQYCEKSQTKQTQVDYESQLKTNAFFMKIA